MKKQLGMVAAAAIIMGGWIAPAAAASNPCNPCAMKQHNPCSMGHKKMNPCNPCSMGHKKMNPCNPCGMKSKSMNPCNPCSAGANPCSVSANTPIRPHAFNSFAQASSLGKKMWGNEALGTSGVACLSCHGDHELLHFDRNQNFPHYVKMVGDVVTLDQMINYCMINPMKGKAFAKNSKEQTAMAAFYRAYRMQYRSKHKQ
ncbi:MAG: hypothetical protein R8J85_03210 [Mariprofundales bacterium]